MQIFFISHQDQHGMPDNKACEGKILLQNSCKSSTSESLCALTIKTADYYLFQLHLKYRLYQKSLKFTKISL